MDGVHVPRGHGRRVRRAVSVDDAGKRLRKALELVQLLEAAAQENSHFMSTKEKALDEAYKAAREYEQAVATQSVS